jgi:hypothetical protein
MTTKERLHKLIDELPDTPETDQRLAVAEHVLQANGTPEPTKPGDTIDEWGNLSAMRRASSRRMLRRMDAEEIAEFGETIADAWGYESPK